MVGQMLQATMTALDRGAMRPEPMSVISELEPIIARQRQAMAQVWQDRSVSKMQPLCADAARACTDQLPMSRLASLLGRLAVEPDGHRRSDGGARARGAGPG